MDKSILEKHIDIFVERFNNRDKKLKEDYNERIKTIKYYQEFDSNKIKNINEETIYEYLSQLWAMFIWGNKHYYIDKIISDNGLGHFKANLSNLVYGKDNIEKRWDEFRNNIKGLGPAMMSEILCKTHPNEYMIWNRRALVALNYLKVSKLPRYDYQLTGKRYKYLCDICKDIGKILTTKGIKNNDLLAVDYFFWDELQVEDNLSNINVQKEEDKTKKDKEEIEEDQKFIHNDIRDKLAEIGEWLGFTTRTEIRIASGAQVDTIWEATIGNMGRVIYVFEVQTSGIIDSLIVNSIKSLNNPAVQGVVAVSDKKQLDKIKKHIEDVKDLKGKLKLWDYNKVLKVHESLAFINSSINELGLVPQSF